MTFFYWIIFFSLGGWLLRDCLPASFRCGSIPPWVRWFLLVGLIVSLPALSSELFWGSVCWLLGWSVLIFSSVSSPQAQGVAPSVQVHQLTPSPAAPVPRVEVNGRLVEQPAHLCLFLPPAVLDSDAATPAIRRWLSPHDIGKGFFLLPTDLETMQQIDSLNWYEYLVHSGNRPALEALKSLTQAVPPPAPVIQAPLPFVAPTPPPPAPKAPTPKTPVAAPPPPSQPPLPQEPPPSQASPEEEDYSEPDLPVVCADNGAVPVKQVTASPDAIAVDVGGPISQSAPLKKKKPKHGMVEIPLPLKEEKP